MKFLLVKNCPMFFLSENFNSDASPWDTDLMHWYSSHYLHFACPHIFYMVPDWIKIKSYFLRTLLSFRVTEPNLLHLALAVNGSACRLSASPLFLPYQIIWNYIWCCPIIWIPTQVYFKGSAFLPTEKIFVRAYIQGDKDNGTHRK